MAPPPLGLTLPPLWGGRGGKKAEGVARELSLCFSASVASGSDVTTNGVIELDHSFIVVGPQGNSHDGVRSGGVAMGGSRSPMFRCIGYIY